jgi:hypothetical protein
MHKQNASSLVLDHTHCRAICDEIGERLHFILKPVTTDLPPRLSSLIARLAELERHGIRPTPSPSIVPAIDELTLAIERAIHHAG